MIPQCYRTWDILTTAPPQTLRLFRFSEVTLRLPPNPRAQGIPQRFRAWDIPRSRPSKAFCLLPLRGKRRPLPPVGRSSNATRAKLALVTSCSSSSFYPPTPGHIRLLNGAYVPLLAGRSRPERPEGAAALGHPCSLKLPERELDAPRPGRTLVAPGRGSCALL